MRQMANTARDGSTAAVDARIAENSALAAGNADVRTARLAAGRRQALRVGANRPIPTFDDAASFWRMMAQLATILMAVIMFGVFLFFARPLLMPLLCALIVAFTIGPLTGYAVKHGLPAWVPALVDRRHHRRRALSRRDRCSPIRSPN